MAAYSPLALKNHAATVQWFNPTTKVGLIAKWRLDDEAISVSERATASVGLREASANAVGLTKRKVTMKNRIPYRPSSIDGITQELQFVEAVCTYIIPSDAPGGVIDDLIANVRHSSYSSMVNDLILDGAFPY